MIWTRTTLPVGMMSTIAFPSGSVLTSRLPSSLPSLEGLRMTAAFWMGLPLDFLVTWISMCEVAGGALYFRPRLTGLSCPIAGQEERSTIPKITTRWNQIERRDSMDNILRRSGRNAAANKGLGG